MAVKKGGLGKGLDSLIPSGAPKNKKNILDFWSRYGLLIILSLRLDSGCILLYN